MRRTTDSSRLRRSYRRPRPRMHMRPRPGRRNGKIRLLLAVAVGAFALISYFSSSSYNPVTGEKQHLALTPKQEIAMGLQAVPALVQQFGGVHPDPQAQALIDEVGFGIVNGSDALQTEWQFEFTLLADPNTVNAFALPGGQIFITEALYSRFESVGQLAGVLGHEIGHVVARHSAQRIAKQNLTQGLIGAILVGSDGGTGTAQTAQAIGQMISMKYGREDELESDALGVRFMAQAGYDPRSMITVMQILAEASGGSRQPEFASTHPAPENRIREIEQAIQNEFPNGIPGHLIR